MTEGALFWFIMTLFWTFVMSFYSTQEMAAISCNKLRVEYYATEKKPWAIKLYSLLENPTLLFSTTLIAVNVALTISSECARRLFSSIGINPNLSPFTHIPFLLLFGELVPMFAARLHADHMSRIGTPLLWASARLFAPLAYIVDLFFRALGKLTGQSGSLKESQAFLSRDELVRILEEHERGVGPEEEASFKATVDNILSFHNKPILGLVRKLSQSEVFSSTSLVKSLRDYFHTHDDEYVLIYHKEPTKILGAITCQDLIGADDAGKAGDFIQGVLFVSEDIHALDILFKLEREKSSIACILNKRGEAIGSLSFFDLFEELFASEATRTEEVAHRFVFVEKTIPADTLIEDFNDAFDVELDSRGCLTFQDLIEQTLGRSPTVADTLVFEPFEITVKEVTLFGAKTLLIKTKYS
jgi:putative hemolysin